MTAEVGVLNSYGVALAADSAVTIGANKVYSSADKLFQLDDAGTVGVMIYGSATFLRLPWETIVKTFRSELGPTRLLSLNDYSQRFVQYLESHSELFSEPAQNEFIDTFASYCCDRMANDIRNRACASANTDNPTDEQVVAAIPIVIQEWDAHLIDARRVTSFTAECIKVVNETSRGKILAVVSQYYETLKLGESLLGSLTDLCVRSFFDAEAVALFPQSTGVVIAGFGEKDYLPKLQEFVFSGICHGKPIYSRLTSVEIGANVEAYVKPFAQTEMVVTFMQGIDPALNNFIGSSTQFLLEELRRSFVEIIDGRDHELAEAIKPPLAKNLQNLMSRLREEWSKARQEKYSDPVMAMVTSLPKDELGAMAESLVNLTKFKRRVSNQQETVGGPIDVAVITKGDGFVWMKRKHYFDRHLNPRYFTRLGRGGCGDED